MNAAVVKELGQSPQYCEFPDPAPAAGEALLHVRAAGIHPLAKSLARGVHYAGSAELPFVAGVDGIGTLEGGARVYFLFVRRPWGTMAELAPAERSMLVPVPDGLSDALAAAIVNPGLSAWMSLRNRAQLAAGESVMILGATGVAGQLTIQAARLQGARRVVAVGRSVELLQGADVDRVICLNDPEAAVQAAFAEEAAAGIHVVIDYLWGRPVEMLIEALAKQFSRTATRCTRLVQLGESAGKSITLSGGPLRSIDLRIMGSGFGSSPLQRILATVPELFRMAAEGALKVQAVPVPLAQAQEAWSRIERGQRIVLVI